MSKLKQGINLLKGKGFFSGVTAQSRKNWLWIGVSTILLLSIAVLSMRPTQAAAAISLDKNLGTNTPASDGGGGSAVSFRTSNTAAANSKIIVVTSMYHPS